MRYREEVLFTGRIETSVLAELMAASHGLVFAPLFEGFGIPLLEAFSCEIPVIASKVTSLPEVCGDAALYADPYSVSSISEAMLQLSENEQLRAKLIEAGRRRKMLFSWDRTSRLLWDCILHAISAEER
jgi:glycosyltransferase involved in cell wall biosynthesis